MLANLCTADSSNQERSLPWGKGGTAGAWLGDLGYRRRMFGRWMAKVLVRGVASLSLRALHRLAATVGTLVYLLGIRRHVVMDNLRHAFPELDERARRRIARGAYVNMALAFLDGLAAHTLTDAAVAERVIEENDILDTELAKGKGILIVTAHFGSWELLGEVMTRRGLPLNTVVKPLRGAINQELIANRVRNGMGLISPRGALREMVRVLRRGDAVVMLIDQVLPAEHGVFVPFFGRPASTNPAAAWAALRSGAPTVVVMAAREGDRLRMYVEGPFAVPPGDRDSAIAAHTATLTAVIERYIRRYPDQWLWLHRRWKVQPPAAPVPLQIQPQTDP
jgi:KDO2-lipid IV(A) lauroyltransferase